MKSKKKYLISIVFICLLVLGLTFLANRSIDSASKPFVSSNAKELKPLKTGLLLGTSRTLKNGKRNDFFYYRIDAAIELFKSSKIKYIIVSGDNSSLGYNEPLDMKNELIARGIPDSLIFLDYAGFRTLDSIIRAREIFGQNSFIVISQEFHNERAVYIARRNGIEAYGYNAKEVAAFKGFKTKIREYFARDKVFIDLLFGVSPKFLGERVTIK